MAGLMAMAGRWTPAAVLLVEDEAASAADLWAARADPPASVLLDLVPGMDGVAVCRRLRAVPRIARREGLHDRHLRRVAGPADGRPPFRRPPAKPFSLDDVLAVVRRTPAPTGPR